MPFNKFFFQKSRKKFLFHFNRKGGRNFLGRICVFHRGGGVFTNYRFIDFFRRLNTFAYVLRIFKDAFHTTFISNLLYFNGLAGLALAAEGQQVGSIIFSGEPTKIEILLSGYSLPLRCIPLFSLVFNVELTSAKGGQYARAAGTGTFAVSKLKNYFTLKMSSGWQVLAHGDAIASLGRASNASHKYFHLSKAGQVRNLGFRPVVRGVVKNPCDHPHGGGEGKGSPPAAQRSPWGKLTKGTPTKNKLKDRLLRRQFKKIK
jgi:large subunit ribosomal protein L2